MSNNTFIKLTIFIAVLFIFSCTGDPTPNPVDENKALDAWMKKNRPDIKKVDNGYYCNIYPNHTDTNKTADTTFLEVRMTGKLLNGSYFMNFYKGRARDLGTFSYKTDYVPFKFQYNKFTNYIGLNVGIMKTIDKMCVGDSAEIVLNSTNAYGSSYDNESYLGFGGPTTIASTVDDVVYMTIKLENMYADAQKLADNETKRYAKDVLGLSVRDSIKTGMYFKKIKEVTTGSIIGKVDTLIMINYSGYLTNNFLFDTSVDSVAKAHNIYDPYTEYLPISYDFKTAEGNYSDMIKAFRFAIKQMRPGEKGVFVAAPRWCYGAEGQYRNNATLIMTYTPLVFTIEIVASTDF